MSISCLAAVESFETGGMHARQYRRYDRGANLLEAGYRELRSANGRSRWKGVQTGRVGGLLHGSLPRALCVWRVCVCFFFGGR